MEPDYITSEPQCPGVVYFEASARLSCYQLADTTHGDSLETNPHQVGDGQEQPDILGTLLDHINRYQRVMTEEPPHTATDSHRPRDTRWCQPYPDESHQHNLGC